jgi:hypothetical protein
MIGFRQVCGVLSLGALAACASKTGTAAASTASGPARWTGSFKQSTLSSSATIGPATPGRAAAYGTITLIPNDPDSGRVRVELSINVSVSPGTQIAWALFAGPCGSPTPPLVGPSEFPTINVSNSGSGFVRTTMPITLNARATYHANVYWSAQVSDVSNVMMCANLTRER